MKAHGDSIGSNLAETGAGIAAGIGKLFEKSLKQTQEIAGTEFKEMLKDAKEQTFGIEMQLEEGTEIDLQDESKAKAPSPEKNKTISTEHQAYFREITTSSEKKDREEQHQLNTQIEEIRLEIAKVQEVSQDMQTVFREISTQQAPVQAGKYHLVFYEWVLLTIQNTRKKMEEVNVLGQMFQSRKREKQYMAMSKKHGTSFTLNNERAIARQTG